MINKVMKLNLMRIFFGMGLIVAASCTGNSSKEDGDNLYKEVIAIHDEVMPKMGTIQNLRTEMNTRISELDSTSADYEDQKTILENQIAELDAADGHMMGWMRNFQVNHEGWPEDSVISYLNNQKVLISDVRDEVNSALESSEELLKR